MENDDQTYALITEINPRGIEEIGKIPVLNETKEPIGTNTNGEYVASIIMVNNTYQLLLGEITSKGIIITNKRVLEHRVPLKTAKKIIYWSPDSRKIFVLETTSTSPNTVETYTIPCLAFSGVMFTIRTVLDITTYSIGEGLVLGMITDNGVYKCIDLVPLDYVGGFPIGIERYYTAISLPNKRGIYVFTKQPMGRELYMPVINVLMLSENNTLVLKGEYPLPLPSTTLPLTIIFVGVILRIVSELMYLSELLPNIVPRMISLNNLLSLPICKNFIKPYRLSFTITLFPSFSSFSVLFSYT